MTSAEQTEAIRQSMQDEKWAQPVAWQYRYSFGDGLYSSWATSETKPNLDDEWEYRPVYLHPAPAQDEKATKDEVIRKLKKAVSTVTDATAAYLPPDGIGASECISRILGATDNPEINAIMLEKNDGRPQD